MEISWENKLLEAAVEKTNIENNHNLSSSKYLLTPADTYRMQNKYNTKSLQFIQIFEKSSDTIALAKQKRGFDCRVDFLPRVNVQNSVNILTQAKLNRKLNFDILSISLRHLNDKGKYWLWSRINT